MAKKEKTPLTFEELAREKERKENKSKLIKLSVHGKNSQNFSISNFLDHVGYF